MKTSNNLKSGKAFYLTILITLFFIGCEDAEITGTVKDRDPYISPSPLIGTWVQIQGNEPEYTLQFLSSMLSVSRLAFKNECSGSPRLYKQLAYNVEIENELLKTKVLTHRECGFDVPPGREESIGYHISDDILTIFGSQWVRNVN